MTQQDTIQLTIAEIIDQARREDLSNKKIRSLLFHAGFDHKVEFPAIRVGLVAETSAGDYVARHANTKCPDQFAGECYAVLKAVELAVEAGLQSCVIRNDRIGGFDASTKRGYIGAKYLWIAKQMSEEQGLAVTFEPCSGSENRADRASRTVG